MKKVLERWETLTNQTTPYKAVRRDGNEVCINGNPDYGSGTKVTDMSAYGYHDQLILTQAGRDYTQQQTITLHREEFMEIIVQFTTPELLRELADKME